MYYFGIIFLVSTTLVLIFKKEEDTHTDDNSLESKLTVGQTYKLMWKILWLIPVKKMILILLTVKVRIFLINLIHPEQNIMAFLINSPILINQKKKA